ncbi:hypothetical protein AB205_0174520 [Aquarana catesbeiana]|uniref:Uncharacterized protein n=1 Tax=Aquarana catesbeiana TaxID=8400 RepID=A0A2G9S0R8_AQUCT|nr:hypothetical protein AB205_0174520 [Aquarana catesbeiana]
MCLAAITRTPSYVSVQWAFWIWAESPPRSHMKYLKV